MLKATLTRTSDDGTCTLGRLEIGGAVLMTLEEPWKDNKRGISCIPEGTYKVVPHGWGNERVRFKRAYRLTGTAPRTAILIHTGNTTDDIEGCILVGGAHGTLKGKQAVLYSLPAMERLRALVGKNSFELTIRFQKEEPRPVVAERITLWQRLFNKGKA